jgi:hypothetical protein
MEKRSGVQLALAATITMRWSDLPAETRQHAREQIARLLRAAARRGLLNEELAGGSGDE